MSELRIIWHEQTSDFGEPMPWFGSWLVGDGETEGGWFHSGRGAAETSHEPPEQAVGVRLRFWPSEGLDPEYIDLPLPESGVIETISLSYDHPGPHSRLLDPRHSRERGNLDRGRQRVKARRDSQQSWE